MVRNGRGVLFVQPAVHWAHYLPNYTNSVHIQTSRNPNMVSQTFLSESTAHKISFQHTSCREITFVCYLLVAHHKPKHCSALCQLDVRHTLLPWYATINSAYTGLLLFA